MPNAPAIIRIFLAALLCAGLCRLDWGQIHDSVGETSRDLVIREAIYDQWDLFAAISTESVAAHTQPVRAETIPFIFGFDKPLTASAPVMVILGQISQEVPEAKSVHGECLKNKDPPSIDGSVPLFSAFVLNPLKLSPHETSFFALRATRLCISIDSLRARHEPGSGSRSGRTG